MPAQRKLLLEAGCIVLEYIATSQHSCRLTSESFTVSNFQDKVSATRKWRVIHQRTSKDHPMREDVPATCQCFLRSYNRD